jgi:hypothetical protein
VADQRPQKNRGVFPNPLLLQVCNGRRDSILAPPRLMSYGYYFGLNCQAAHPTKSLGPTSQPPFFLPSPPQAPGNRRRRLLPGSREPRTFQPSRCVYEPWRVCEPSRGVPKHDAFGWLLPHSSASIWTSSCPCNRGTRRPLGNNRTWVRREELLFSSSSSACGHGQPTAMPSSKPVTTHCLARWPRQAGAATSTSTTHHHRRPTAAAASL